MMKLQNQKFNDEILANELKSIESKSLHRDEELLLLYRAKLGDTEAKKELCKSYLPTMVKIISSLDNNTFSYDELINDATIIFLEAFDKYQFDYAHPFKTYVKTYLERVLKNKLQKQTDSFGIPANIRFMIDKIEDVKGDLAITLGREPSKEEIIEELGISMEEYDKLMSYNKEIVPYDVETVNDDSIDNITNTSFAEDPEYVARKVIEAAKNAGYLYEAMKKLPSLEQEILTLKYGLGGDDPKSFDEISQIIGLTVNRVRQIHAKAIVRLKHHSKWEDYDSVVHRTI